MALTDTTCRNAAGREKPYRIFDKDGLYLEVAPSGARYWRFKYRFGGKEKRLALGVYPEVSLKEARARTAAARALLRDDIDPGAQRAAQKRAARIATENAFEAVANEWFRKHSPHWVASHVSDVERRLKKDLYPSLGARPINEIDAPELLAVLRKIEARGAHDLAHRVCQLAGQVMRYAIACGKAKHDIAHDLRGALTPNVKNNQPAVPQKDLPALMRAIDAYEEIGDRQTKLALLMLAHTAVRTSELINATWDEFDGDLWTIPAERMKKSREHLVPLSPRVKEMLAEIRQLCGDSKFLFPGRNRDKPISNNTMLFALYRLGYKGKMTGHGFRALFSTIANEHSWNSDWIEMQLAHWEDSVRKAYNRALYLDDRRRLLCWWSEYLDGARDGAKVVPIKAA